MENEDLDKDKRGKNLKENTKNNNDDNGNKQSRNHNEEKDLECQFSNIMKEKYNNKDLTSERIDKGIKKQSQYQIKK